MKKLFFLLSYLSIFSIVYAQPYNPSGITVAGGNGMGGGNSQLWFPSGLFIDNNGNIYVGDNQNSRVQKFPPGSDSTTQGITVAGGSYGSAANQLNQPGGIFLDGSGNLYVADVMNNRVQKFLAGSTSATNGVTVAGNGVAGDSADQLNMPAYVFVDGSGNLYVSDAGNNRVQKFPAGSSATTNGVTVAGGNGKGAAPDQLWLPAGIFVDGGGNLYVADRANSRIQKFPAGSTSATNGITIAGQDTLGSNAAFQLNKPTGIFVDESGNIFVADYSNNRIQQFPPNSTADTNGVTIAGFDTATTILTQLNGPVSVWLDHLGNVYVTDENNNRVQEYQDSATLTGINASIPQDFNMEVAPNPFSENTTLTVYLTKEESVNIQVFNMLGQKLESVQTRFNRGRNEIAIGTNLSAGNYFINLIAGSFNKTVKITAVKN